MVIFIKLFMFMEMTPILETLMKTLRKKIADLVMEMKIRKKIPLINLVKKTKKKHLPKRFM